MDGLRTMAGSEICEVWEIKFEGGGDMPSRAKKKKLWRKENTRREENNIKTNGQRLAELFAKGHKCVDITNGLYR